LRANLIISLDCEGKWGLSNQPKIIAQFTNNNLIRTYEKINNLFSSLKIPVTYAFVGALILKKQERKNFECFENFDKCYSLPLQNFFRADNKCQSEGWFLPEIYDLVNNNINEMASHSFSHLLFSHKTSKSKIENELINCQIVSNLKKKKFKTFVFPYNKISNLDLIKKFGFIGYRYHQDYRKDLYSKIKNLYSEWNIWAKYEMNCNNFNQDMVQIPGGAFLNWRFKWRKYLIHPEITVCKWKNLLKQCVRSKKTLNLWFHPHNILSAPSTFDVLKKIILEAYKMREKGKLNIITQKRYVEKVMMESRKNFNKKCIQKNAD